MNGIGFQINSARFFDNIARVAQLVEHHLAKVDVASSNLVSRSKIGCRPDFIGISRSNFMYYAYILYSQSRDRYYYGHCENLEKRIRRHNSGINPYTKSGIPWEIQYFESFATKSEAVKREMQFKKWKSRKMVEQLISQGGCRPD